MLKFLFKLKNEILVIAESQHAADLFPFMRRNSLIHSDLRNLIIYVIKDQNLVKMG